MLIEMKPDADLDTNEARVEWVRRERQILAEDVAAAGERLVAATAWIGGPSGFHAMMLTKTLSASVDLAPAFIAGAELMNRLIGEVTTYRKSCSITDIDLASFELTFGDELIGVSDSETLAIFPAMSGFP